MANLLTAITVALAILVSAGGGYLVVIGLFRLIAKEPQRSNSGTSADNVLRGGTWIGILERAATTAAIIAGQPMLIGVIVAIKGFGRFDQLRDNPAASEKFTVGTLASLVWAGAVGAAANLLIGLLG